MSNPLLSSYSSCFVFTKHPVQLKTVTTNGMFSKYVLFKKGHLNKRAGVLTPWTPLDLATGSFTSMFTFVPSLIDLHCKISDF